MYKQPFYSVQTTLQVLQGYCLVHSLSSFNLTCNGASLDYKSLSIQEQRDFCLPKEPSS
jgi:hypothetical protein